MPRLPCTARPAAPGRSSQNSRRVLVTSRRRREDGPERSPASCPIMDEGKGAGPQGPQRRPAFSARDSVWRVSPATGTVHVETAGVLGSAAAVRARETVHLLVLSSTQQMFLDADLKVNGPSARQPAPEISRGVREGAPHRGPGSVAMGRQR